ncbi:amino acid adenylation domain-containing protein/thioester reductase-like protein [Kitasatospora sp. MAA19]|uniref:amino acid adenylation domain-containing protein n=1 Tax=Kitasatospora sp. MAA19 TaxID=3035090 RepID=UPI0024732972|nr:amino acid adenylation domain-containing protein [Kitasatospora sp. MAA19]MDH6711019.1 amino acid adenylation domain-containing protein/thioester reductase-like protein [Kitasatospora sp. MAA19]
MDDAADSAQGVRTDVNSGRHAVVRNDNGQYAIWPGDLTVPGGWQRVYGPAARAACRAYVEREWRPPGLGFPGEHRRGRAVAAGLADTVHGLFASRAARDPDAVAVIAEDATLSYRELDRRSDRLARALRARGVGTEQVVPVCLDRGAGLVVAWLGVLKAGAAFLPLDPGFPERRLARLVEDCGARVAVTDGRDLPGTESLAVDAGGLTGPLPEGPSPDGAGPDGALPGDALPDDVGPDDLAYLIYTSGTTGTPKGVPVTHRSLVFTLDRVVRGYGLTPGERVLQLAALGFDTALEQVFAALHAGASLVLGGGRTWAPTELVQGMDELGLAVVDLTPAYWHHVLALLPPGGPGPDGLRLVLVGGDTVHADDCRSCLDRLPGVRLVNAYGVTEAAVTSTLCEVTPALLDAAPGGPAAPVPIGRPLPGVRVHVLDARLNPVRPGEKGEIHLGGPGLARGYWRAPVSTAESFLPDPYAPVPGERMYRTGDAGRWRADGQLEIFGRFDDQVKVRGYRVDPAEIEAVLAAHPEVRQARVAADGEASDGSHVLTAYYTLADGAADAGTAAAGSWARRVRIRAYLAERLPAYLVPTEFVVLADLPLTPAGKVDRRLLSRADPRAHRPDGGARQLDGGAHRPDGGPRAPDDGPHAFDGTVEAAIGHLWTELLGGEEVGPADDFFALGGNSLLAMEMLARARIMLGIDVTRIRALTRALLRDATLRAFATAVRLARADGSGAGEAAVDWAAEARLTHPVAQSWSPAPSRAEPAEILLTGATGFCGAHLLHALLATTGARIHCLVRAPDEEHALERLRAAQQRFLRHDLVDPRVVPLVGDLAEPGLGLTQRQFDRLAGSLDAIHHLGGQVNFIYPYHQLRGPNVGGTREIVRLAGHSRGIPVHYLSTLAVLAGFGAARVGEVTERTPLAHPDKLGVGYVESKWVAEQLLHNAAAAGLPVTVLRTNDVTGDLATGVMNTGTEICALIKYLADSGTCPDVRLLLDFVPADRFGRAVAHIAAHAPANGEVYHLTSPDPAVLADLAERLRARGHPIAELPYGEWVQGLVRFAAGHPGHPITPFVPLFVDRAPGSQLSLSEMYFRPTFPRFDRTNTDAALAGSGIELPAVDAGLLDHYLRRLAAEGFLGPPPQAPRG